MKKGLHPDYKDTKITCHCGNVVETRSTVENIQVEICSSCHPFFTGKQKLVDSGGRVERFRRRYAKAGIDTEQSAPSGAEDEATEPAEA